MDDTAVHSVLLRVEGMTCTGCEERIGKVLARLDGVRQAAADHRAGEVTVAFDPARVAPEALAERVERAGFRVVAREEEAAS